MAIVVDARQLTALSAWFITIAACVGPAWSEPSPLLAIARAGAAADWPPGGESPRPSPAIVRLNALEALAVGGPAPAPADPDLPTLTTSVAQKEPTDLRLPSATAPPTGGSVSLGGAVNCALGRLMSARTTLSFEAGYDRYADAVVPASSSRAISGFVLLKLAGF